MPLRNEQLVLKVYTLDLASASGEYELAIPMSVQKIRLGLRDGTAFKIAFKAGDIADGNYFGVDTEIELDGVFNYANNEGNFSVFVQPGAATKVLEALVWRAI